MYVLSYRKSETCTDPLCLRITAQLVPHNIRRSSTLLTPDEVYSEGRHVSFRWDDLIAIAPWMEERLTRSDDDLTI
jgi:hypothetical protein